MKKYVILILILVVAVSGCTSSRSVKTTQGDGITIDSFTADPLAVSPNDAVLLDMTVENTGGTTARNAQVDLFGVDNYWKDSAGNLISGTDTKDLGDLQPPQPANNVPGDLKPVHYTLEAPDVPQGITVPASITARVSYDYNTNGLLDIPTLSTDRVRQMQANSQALPAPTFSSSAGPITITVDTSNNQVPIRIDTTDSGASVQEWPLKFLFTNQGSGFPITQDDLNILGGGKIIGTIAISGAGNPQFADCLGQTSGNTIDLSSSDIPVHLRKDTSKSFPAACVISIDKSSWNNRPEDSVKITFQLSYRYFTESSVAVRITGK